MFDYKKVRDGIGSYIPAEYAVTYDGARVGTLAKAVRGPWIVYVGWDEHKSFIGKYYGCSVRKPLAMIANYFGEEAKIS